MTRVRYSDSFKRQIVDEVERGRHGSLNGVAQAYGIGGMSTIARWIRQYGREDLLPKNVRVETLKERDKLKEARKRIRELEAAVADAHMDYCLERGFLRVACERLGEEPEVFKKKHAMTWSSKSGHFC